ncbi:hypothetical protein MVES1_000361 [Malassezia vespertilionis]|uniref:uncharacterized protein n=1 Tax=Malassezia vespertilionis TaxID=2020962 RepID=UPI0024B1B5E6|nr:uncharacterized protein MVES1_000361 [Malassezia vespertilionis]WFD05036.1 hypothetical protein MVES1_000361 [Malassezia vespertilionis]
MATCDAAAMHHGRALVRHGTRRTYTAHAGVGAVRAALEARDVDAVAASIQQPAMPRADVLQGWRFLTEYLHSTAPCTRSRRIAQSVAMHDVSEGPCKLPEALVSLRLAASLHTAPSLAAFTSVRAQHAHWTPSPQDWDMVLCTLARARHGDTRACWEAMQHANIAPSASGVHLYIAATAPNAPAATLDAIVDEIGVAIDRVSLSVLLQAYCKRIVAHDTADLGRARRVAEALRVALGGAQDRVGWNTWLQYMALVQSMENVLEHAHRAGVQHAFKADSFTFSILAEGYARSGQVQTCDDALRIVERIQNTIHVRPGRIAASIFLKAILRTADPFPLHPHALFEAHSFFDEVRHLYNIQPDPAMVQPLVEAHCSAFVPDLDAACALLRVFVASLPPKLAFFRWRTAPHKIPKADLGLYYPILLACARMKNLPRALLLLSAMASHKLRVPSHAAHTLLHKLWQACTTYKQAWDMYTAVHALRSFDATTYARVLAHFCKLRLAASLESSIIPPPPVYALHMLADMRAAHMHPTAQTYTVLLNFFAKSERATEAIVQATHELIKRDVQLEPDLILINALMNAYNHVDAPVKVLGIWDSLVVLCTNTNSAHYLDDVSLAIVCDTCGRAGMLGAARRAVRTVQQLERARKGTLYSKTAQDAWVECLARCGHLEEAAHVALDEMEAPDAKTLQTLLKFAASAQGDVGGDVRFQEMRTRVRTKYPGVWGDVCSIE